MNRCNKQILTLIQNVSQIIGLNGESIIFQKFNKTKFARLLSNGKSIKIRKNGTYILTVSGNLQWTLNSNVTLSFALLVNGIPLTETIQNRNIPAGIYSYSVSITSNFTFKKDDILNFQLESSIPVNTFVPSITSNSNLFFGDGLTLSMQSVSSNQQLQTASLPLYPRIYLIEPNPEITYTFISNPGYEILTVAYNYTNEGVNYYYALVIQSTLNRTLYYSVNFYGKGNVGQKANTTPTNDFSRNFLDVINPTSSNGKLVPKTSTGNLFYVKGITFKTISGINYIDRILIGSGNIRTDSYVFITVTNIIQITSDNTFSYYDNNLLSYANILPSLLYPDL